MNIFRRFRKYPGTPPEAQADYGIGGGGEQYSYPVDMPRSGYQVTDTFRRKQNLVRLRLLQEVNPLFNAIINSALINIIGSEDHLQIQIKSDDKVFSDEMEDMIDKWLSGKPETRGIYSGVDLFHRIFSEILVCGEAFFIFTDSGQIQLIEPELVDGMGEGIMDGIRFDDYDSPIEYRVGRYTESGLVSFENPRLISAENLVHKFIAPRISSVRGISPLTPSLDLLFRLNQIFRSEIRSWELISKIALLTIRKDGAERALFENSPNGTTDDGIYLENWSDEAMVFHGSPEEELRTLERNIPSKDFPQSLLTFLRVICSPLGLSPELVLSDFTKANYSQSRATAILTHRNLKRYQRIAKDIINQIVAWKIEDYSGDSEPPEYHTDIYLPKAFMLSTKEEVETLSDRVGTCISSHSEIAGEYGWDLEELLDVRAIEIQMAIQKSKEIEEKTGEHVPWQILSGISKLAESPKTIPGEEPSPTEEVKISNESEYK